jgi:hypothetical protein
MLSVIMRAPLREGRCVIHGVKPTGCPIALKATTYMESLGSMYHLNQDLISLRSPYGLLLDAPIMEGDGKAIMQCEMQSDERALTLRSLLQDVSIIARGSFWPDKIGMAFPLNVENYRALRDQLLSIEAMGSKNIWGTHWKVRKREVGFAHGSIMDNIDALCTIEPLRGPSHSAVPSLDLMIAHLKPEHNEVCEEGEIDPHLLVMHPKAVRWF